MKRILSATALALAFAGANVVSEMPPQQPVVEPPKSVEAAACCDDCKCCSACDCGGDVGSEVQPVEVPKPAKILPKSPRQVGELRTINGRQHKLVSSALVGDEWRHYYEPVAVPVASSVQPGFSTGYYSGGSQWTYPGRIDNHLTSSHGVSRSQLSGMSKQEQERLHDSLHNGTPNRPVYRQPVYRQPVRSNCPGGVCPTPTRRGFFR